MDATFSLHLHLFDNYKESTILRGVFHSLIELFLNRILSKMILDILAVVVTPLNEVGKFLFGSLKHQYDYLMDCDTNIQNLRSEARQLKVKSSDVQDLVKEARRRSEIPYGEVVEWLKDTEATETEMKYLVDEEVNAKMKCFIGLCPDLRSRVKLSKEAASKVELIISLKNRGNFAAIAHAPSPQPVEFVRTGSIVDNFPSRDSILELVMKALGDDNIGTIAVHGMGGIGKTTLMIKINNEYRVNKLFKKVILVFVKKEPDLKAIQDDIADSLGLHLKDETSEHRRSNILYERLKREETVLIILDNLWKKIKLTEIGIPNASEHIGCKVILSSRDRDVCSQMRIQEIIKIGFLPDSESWTLFKAKVGDVVELPNLKPKAKKIVSRCRGSPLAIVTLGSALKDLDDEAEWNHALSVLSNPDPSGVESIMSPVVKSLKFSYDSLHVPEIKLCFLFCCLFPADYNIKLCDLRNYGIGDGFLKCTETLDAASNELRSHVNKLKNCCLLLDGDEEMSVKMHDVVRDVAISIASKDENGFLVSIGGPMKNLERDTEKMRGFKRISLMNNDTKSAGALKLECSQLRSLLIRGNRFPTSHEVRHDSLFERIQALGLLDLWSIFNWRSSILSTQKSLSHLTHLRTLYLIACDVSDKVSLLGELKTLEILSLRDSNVGKLEKEIGNLTNLKCLDLTGAELEIIAPKVISRLSKLEELYTWNNFDGWDTKERHGGEQNAKFSEVASLHHLSILEIRVTDVVSRNLHSANCLNHFRVAVNDKPRKLGSYMNNNDLCIRDSNLSKHWVNKLMSNSVKKLVLRVESCIGFNSVIDLDAKNLDYLDVSYCNEIKSLIRIERTKVLSQNRVLPQLRVIHALGCQKLKNIFSTNLFLYVENLEDVTVGNCDELEEVFNIEGDVKVEGEVGLVEPEIQEIGAFPVTAMFPRLKHIELWGLNNLTSIWKGVIPAGTLGNLRELRVRHCNSLKYMLTEGFQSLETLEVFNCGDLEKLMHFKREADTSSSSVTPRPIPNLRHLKIIGCPKLMNLFSFDVARDFHVLNSLCIQDCHKLKELIGNEEDQQGEEEAVDSQALLSQLQYLEIKNLEALTSFYQGNLLISCPLVEIKVINCPHLEGLPLDRHFVSSLSKIQGDFRWLQALDLQDESPESTTSSDKEFEGEEETYRQEEEVDIQEEEPENVESIHTESIHSELSVEGEEIDESDGIQQYDWQSHERPIHDRQHHESKFSESRPAVTYYYVPAVENAGTDKFQRYVQTTIGFIFIILSILGIGVLANSMGVVDRGLQLFASTPIFSILMNWNKSPLPPFDQEKEIRAEWKPEQEAFLIDLIEDMVKERGENTLEEKFSKDEWLKIQSEYYMEWGLKYKLRAFREMFRTLEQRFLEFKKLIENFGGLESDSEFAINAPESWWASYVKIHPNAKRFRSQGCPECKKLETIFGITIQKSDNFLTKDKSHQNTYQLERKDSKVPELSITATMQPKASHAKQEIRSKLTITECIKILNAMDMDIGRRTYVRALKLLQDEGWREVFLHMSDARRKDMLLSIEDGDL